MKNPLSIFKQSLIWASGLGLAASMFVGCSSSADQNAFEKASPEIKANWDRALAADKANDYFTASTSYANVLKEEIKLTPQQLALLESTSRALTQRMMAAAESGDPAAKQALVKLMQAQRQR